MSSQDANDIDREHPLAEAAADDAALRERSDLVAAAQDFRVALKRNLAIATAVFAAVSMVLFAAARLRFGGSVFVSIAAALQVVAMLWLVPHSVYAISNLHQRNLWVDAMTALGYVVATVVASLACSYCVFGLASSDQPWISDYPSSLYFSVVTITTLGYGDLRPIGASRLFASVEAVVGYVLLGTFVGLLVSRMMPSRHDGADC